MQPFISREAQSAAAGRDSRRQLTQQLLGIAPTDTGIGDALTVGQRIGLPFDQILTPLNEVALYHHPEHGLATGGDLLADVGADFHLLLVLLGAIGVAEIHHHLLRQTGLGQIFGHRGHMLGAVVRALAAAQNGVAMDCRRSARWPNDRIW